MLHSIFVSLLPYTYLDTCSNTILTKVHSQDAKRTIENEQRKERR